MSCSYSSFCSNHDDFKCNEYTNVADSPEKMYEKFMDEVNHPGFKKKFIEGYTISKKEEKLQTNSKMVTDKDSWKFDKRIAENGLHGKAGKVAKCHCYGVLRVDMPEEIGVSANCITKHYTTIKTDLVIKTDKQITPKLTR